MRELREGDEIIMLRLFRLSDFVKEVKRSGDAYARGEVIYLIVPGPENKPQIIFKIVLTAMIEKMVAIFEDLGEPVDSADEVKVKETEKTTRETFEKLKSKLETDHGFVVKPGIYQ